MRWPEAPRRVKPEQHRALLRFHEALCAEAPCIQPADLASMGFLPSGFAALALERIRACHLPSGPTWQWMQSNRTTSHNVSGMDVKLSKIAPRKLPRARATTLAPPPPSFKAWLITARSSPDSEIYFLWVERGLDGQGIQDGYSIPPRAISSPPNFPFSTQPDTSATYLPAAPTLTLDALCFLFDSSGSQPAAVTRDHEQGAGRIRYTL